MPRITRGLVDGMTYHVLNRGNGKQRVFYEEADYVAFLGLVSEAQEREDIEILAYCLMPNHFHLVVTPAEAGGLSRWMQWLMTSHVRRYHQHYDSSGHVWQGRYKSFIIQDGLHLLTVLRYVEGNPVRASMVRSARDWWWSSHRERLGLRQGVLVSVPPIELPKNWGQFVDQPLTDGELGGVRQSVIRQSPYGESDWRMAKATELGLESTIRPPGRPRKNSD